VTILLDTQCWLWWLVSPEKLSPSALDQLADGENTLLLSAASSWEIAIKYALGKLPLPEPPETFVPSRIARDGVTPLPVEHTHALRVSALPLHHRDPFDRLIIAQAQIEAVPVMTVDPVFLRYGVEVIRGDAT
jgi:PIN domain nuclease of toxin-antitoxin system